MILDLDNLLKILEKINETALNQILKNTELTKEKERL